jgi:hypothetical protein
MAPQPDKLGPLRADRLEWNARQPQETRRVLGGGEAFDKGHFHQIEIWLTMVVIGFCIWLVRRLPLHGARRLRVIVPGPGRAVAVVVMIVIVSPVHDSLLI